MRRCTTAARMLGSIKGWSSVAALLALWSTTHGPVIAQVPPQSNESVAGQDGSAYDESLQLRVAELIQQLASPEFSLREQATADLLALGEAAIKQLRTPPTGLTFEARTRCQRIESKISTELFALRSRQFLLDSDGQHNHGLVGWEQFREIVGTTRTSKLLFLEMLEADSELVQLIVTVHSDKGSQAKSFEQLTERLVTTADELHSRLYTHVPPKLGEYVGLLYAAVTMPEPPPIEVNRTLFSACQFSFGGYLHKVGYEDCLKRLLSGWIPRTHDGMASDAIRLAHGLALPVAAPIARTRLSANFDVATRSAAFQYLAFYGQASDLPALLEYADDATVVEEYSDLESDIAVARVAPPGIPFVPPAVDEERKTPLHTVWVSDLAAVAAMLVLGDDPSRVFPRYSGQLEGKLILHELAVSAEDAPKQSAAIQAWVRKQFGGSPQG